MKNVTLYPPRGYVGPYQQALAATLLTSTTRKMTYSRARALATHKELSILSGRLPRVISLNRAHQGVNETLDLLTAQL